MTSTSSEISADTHAVIVGVGLIDASRTGVARRPDSEAARPYPARLADGRLACRADDPRSGRRRVSCGPVLIAIDGPSGAGKGTVARAIADALQCRHVDTGAMYRAVAWRAVDRGIDLDDEAVGG